MKKASEGIEGESEGSEQMSDWREFRKYGYGCEGSVASVKDRWEEKIPPLLVCRTVNMHIFFLLT